jgi:hypothetical protein
MLIPVLSPCKHYQRAFNPSWIIQPRFQIALRRNAHTLPEWITLTDQIGPRSTERLGIEERRKPATAVEGQDVPRRAFRLLFLRSGF